MKHIAIGALEDVLEFLDCGRIAEAKKLLVTIIREMKRYGSR